MLCGGCDGPPRSEFLRSCCHIENHGKDRNKVRSALQAKESKCKNLQIIGIRDGAGRVAGALRVVEVEVIRGGLLMVEYREVDIKDC